MRISDWSSDVCSSALLTLRTGIILLVQTHGPWVWAGWASLCLKDRRPRLSTQLERPSSRVVSRSALRFLSSRPEPLTCSSPATMRSEEHTSELQSLMRISYAVFCLKKKNITLTIVHYKPLLL